MNKSYSFLKQNTIILGYEKNTPILSAWIIDEVHCAFWCEYCHKPHLHGVGDGHRASHCVKETPYSKTGYILKIQEGEPYA